MLLKGKLMKEKGIKMKILISSRLLVSVGEEIKVFQRRFESFNDRSFKRGRFCLSSWRRWLPLSAKQTGTRRVKVLFVRGKDGVCCNVWCGQCIAELLRLMHGCRCHDAVIEELFVFFHRWRRYDLHTLQRDCAGIRAVTLAINLQRERVGNATF